MGRGFDGYPGASHMGGIEDDDDEYQEVMMKRSICYLFALSVACRTCY